MWGKLHAPCVKSTCEIYGMCKTEHVSHVMIHTVYILVMDLGPVPEHDREV